MVRGLSVKSNAGSQYPRNMPVGVLAAETMYTGDEDAIICGIGSRSNKARKVDTDRGAVLSSTKYLL